MLPIWLKREAEFEGVWGLTQVTFLGRGEAKALDFLIKSRLLTFYVLPP